MTTNDVKTILSGIASALGLPVYKDVHPPVTKETVKEMVVVNVISKSDAPWSKGYANINIFVPYQKVAYAAPNTKRLGELEALAEPLFRNVYGKKTDEYLITLDSIRTEEDADIFSYYINVRVKFQISNFKL